MRSECRYKLAALFGAALCLSDVVAPARAASILDQQDPDSPAVNETVLSRMTARLSRRLHTGESAPTVVASSPKALDLVSGSIPAFMTLAQRDVVAARFQAAIGATVEVYGRVPACVLVLGRPGWSLGMASARSIDVGVPQGWTAETINILSKVEPLLASSRVEHRGGARALDRVQNGEEDIAFVMVYDDTLDPVTRAFLKDGSLSPIPFFGASHVREASKSGLHYQSGQVTVPVAHSWWRKTRYETICTTLGVAVNPAANARLVETAVASLTSGTIDKATASFEKLWEKVRPEYDAAIEKLRSAFSSLADAPELKEIATNLGVGAPEQKPGLVRPGDSEEVSHVQPSKGISIKR